MYNLVVLIPLNITLSLVTRLVIIIIITINGLYSWFQIDVKPCKVLIELKIVPIITIFKYNPICKQGNFGHFVVSAKIFLLN